MELSGACCQPGPTADILCDAVRAPDIPSIRCRSEPVASFGSITALQDLLLLLPHTGTLAAMATTVAWPQRRVAWHSWLIVQLGLDRQDAVAGDCFDPGSLQSSVDIYLLLHVRQVWAPQTVPSGASSKDVKCSVQEARVHSQ